MVSEKLTFGKGCRKALKFILNTVAFVLDDSHKENEYEPTMYERTHGEKMYMSDKYFIPENKLR